MRASFLAVLAAIALLGACSRGAPPATPAPPSEAIDATVVGPDGPVPGAVVRLLALAPAPCPCATQLEPHDSGDAVPECACPAALASMRERFARCDASSALVGEVHADARGNVRIAAPPQVTALEVVGSAGLLWLPRPPAAAPIALSLATAERPRIRISGMGSARAPSVRGAVLYDDGHCVPLVRAGDAWVPSTPLPDFEGAAATLVVEAAGYATKVMPLYQDDVHIELPPARPITGTCDGATVRLENPFQQLVAKVDASKQFSIAGALAMNGTVTCWADAQTVVDEWDYVPGEQLASGGMVYGGLMSAPCTDVKVIDAANRPVADADVTFMRPMGGAMSSGTSATTDARGIACVDGVGDDGEITVTAPQHAGGQCAGETQFDVERQHLQSSPIVVRLRIQPVTGTSLRGRVLAADGTPIAHARVATTNIDAQATQACEPGGDATTTALDGSFVLSRLPRGRITLGVEHEWFTPRELTVTHDGSAHDIKLERGGRWTGRLLDPDGAPIERCFMSLQLVGARTLYASCSAGAFTFRTLTPGPAKLRVKLENHRALGTFRALEQTIQLGAGAHRREDVQFPRGQDITGRIVDARGHAIPRGELSAIPAGSQRPGGRLHEQEVQIVADEHGRFAFRDMTPGTWRLGGIGRTYTQATLDVATGTRDAVFVVPAKK